MQNDIQKIQDDFIEFAGNLCASMNITRIIGQLYALLYMSEEPVSMDDMVKRLDVSKGNVSVNINILEGWGAVRKVWVKGSRKNYYMADPDVWKIVKKRVEEALSSRLDRTVSAIDNINKGLEEVNSNISGEEKKKVRFYKKRMNNIDSMKNKLANIQKMLKSLNIY